MKLIIAVFSLAVGVVPVFAGGGVQVKKATEVKTISREAAEKAALGIVKGGVIKEGELENEKGLLIWSFDIKDGAKTREIWIDAKTGLPVQDSTETAADEKAEKVKDAAETKAKAAGKAVHISREAAQKTALSFVKGGVVQSAELEKEEGKDVWSFDIASGGFVRKIWIDAVSGLILQDKMETAAEEKAETEEDAAANKTARITREAAEKTALEGIAGGIVKKAELDNENGKSAWSFKIEAGGKMHEVKVDAVTGRLVPEDEESGSEEREENNEKGEGGEH